MTRKPSHAADPRGGPDSRDSDVAARLESAGKGTLEIRPQAGEYLLSPRSRELLGIEGDGAITVQRFVAAMHASDRERWKHVPAQLLHTDGCDECRFTFRTAGWPERRLLASARAFFKGTRGVRLVGTLQDITDQERAVTDEVEDASDRLKGVLCGGAGEVVLRRDRVSLTDICRAAIDQARLAHPGHPIELGRWEAAFGDWDRDLLVEMARRLLASARRHDAAGEPVIVSVLDCGDAALLVVADRDRTMPQGSPAAQPDPPLGRAGSTDHRPLRILHEIVRAHGGWLEPGRDDRGTTVRVWLPKVL